jgi:hypothetical protein
MKNFKIIIALLMIICVMAVVCSCSKDEKHYHSYSAEWNNDVNNHWHVCTGEDCDNIVGITPHKFGEGVVTTPATEESDGLMTYKCSVCGFEKNEVIAKLPVGHKHELQKVDGVEPTCVDKGVETYYVCSCGMKFADEQGENEISYPVVIDEKGHTPVDFGEHVDPTCDTAGIEKGKKCSDCGIIITEEKMISPLGHIWNEGAITKHATCFSEGVKTFECTVCGAKKTEAVAIDANAHVWPKAGAAEYGWEHRSFDHIRANESKFKLPLKDQAEHNLNTELHTFGFLWREDYIAFTGDGKIYCDLNLDEEGFEDYKMAFTTVAVKVIIAASPGVGTGPTDTSTEEHWTREKSDYITDYLHIYQLDDGWSRMTIRD